MRKKLATKKEIKKFCPLSRISKQRVANALKLERLQKAKVTKQLQDIRKKLTQEAVEVSNDAHKRLSDIMETSKKDSFTQLFWKEQQKAFSCKSGGMRWHPMMIRFAILLHSQSPAAYRTLREVGSVKLPAESTLRDYANVLHPKSGFNIEVFLDLKQQAESLEENQRWVCLLHDEISIKSDLVYDRVGVVSGKLLAWVNATMAVIHSWQSPI